MWRHNYYNDNYYYFCSGIWRSRFRCCAIRVSGFVVFHWIDVHFTNCVFLLQESSNRNSLQTEHRWHSPNSDGAWQGECLLCELVAILSFLHLELSYLFDIVCFHWTCSHRRLVLFSHFWLGREQGTALASEWMNTFMTRYNYLICDVISYLLFLVCVIFRFWITSLMLKKMWWMKRDSRWVMWSFAGLGDLVVFN